MSIIRDHKALSRAIDTTFSKMKKVNLELMCQAVSVVWHMGEHRDPSLLNKMYSGLPKAMQATFKRWIVEKTLDAIRLLSIDPNVSDLPFEFKKERFSVKTVEVMPNSVELTSAIASFMLEHEEDTGFGNFMEINPDKSPPPFDVIYISKQLHALLTKADKKGGVPATVKMALAEAVRNFDMKVRPEIEEVEAKTVLYARTTHGTLEAVAPHNIN